MNGEMSALGLVHTNRVGRIIFIITDTVIVIESLYFKPFLSPLIYFQRKCWRMRTLLHFKFKILILLISKTSLLKKNYFCFRVSLFTILKLLHRVGVTRRRIWPMM